MEADWDEAAVLIQPPWHGGASSPTTVASSTPPSPGRRPVALAPDPAAWLAGIQISSSTSPNSPTFSLVSTNPFGLFMESSIPAGKPSSSRMCTPGQSGACSPAVPGVPPRHADVHMVDAVVADEFAFGSGAQQADGLVRAWEGERIHEDSGSDDLELTPKL